MKAVTVGDRADSYGAGGGNLALELRAALQADRGNDTRVLSRIYGLGGKDFFAADAEQFLADALEAATSGQVREAFAYHGVAAATPGESLQFVTQGDANPARDAAAVPARMVRGRVLWQVSRLGSAVDWLQWPRSFLLLVVLPGSVLVLSEWRARRTAAASTAAIG